MASLKRCLQTLTNSGELSRDLEQDVLDTVAEYVRDGYVRKEAESEAVQLVLQELKDELRSVYLQLGIDPNLDPLLRTAMAAAAEPTPDQRGEPSQPTTTTEGEAHGRDSEEAGQAGRAAALRTPEGEGLPGKGVAGPWSLQDLIDNPDLTVDSIAYLDARSDTDSGHILTGAIDLTLADRDAALGLSLPGMARANLPSSLVIDYVLVDDRRIGLKPSDYHDDLILKVMFGDDHVYVHQVEVEDVDTIAGTAPLLLRRVTVEATKEKAGSTRLFGYRVEGLPLDLFDLADAIDHANYILVRRSSTSPIGKGVDQDVAEQLADAPAPTESQKEAGNYQKATIRLHGLEVSIETPKGGTRSGVDANGTPWQVTLPDHYGYIKGTVGADKDHIDIFVGPKPENGVFWIINQTKPGRNDFDEHKVMVGFDSELDAVASYLLSFSDDFGAQVLGPVAGPYTADEFKALIPALAKAQPVGVEAKKPKKAKPLATPEQERERFSLISEILYYETSPQPKTEADKRDRAKKLKAAQKRLGKLPPGMYSEAAIRKLGMRSFDAIERLADIHKEFLHENIAEYRDTDAVINSYGTGTTNFDDIVFSREYVEREVAAILKSAAKDGVTNTPPALDLPTVKYDGDTWHIVGRGAVDELDGKTFAHLSSTTRGVHTKNGISPVQIAAWVKLPPEAPGTAPEHAHNQNKPLDPDTKYEPTAQGDVTLFAPIDTELVPMNLSVNDFAEVIDEWAAMFADPEGGRVNLDKQAGPFLSADEAQARVDAWKARVREQFENNRGANSGKTVLSLFDLTGEWSKPWRDAGYNVITFDIQSGQDVMDFSVDYFNDNWDFGEVYAILAACPCTDFASSGARWFVDKDADGRTEASKQLVFQTMKTIEYFRPVIWALENPVGRIENLTGLPKSRLSFQPHHFGSTYTKKTMLWGNFNPNLPTANVDPVEGSKMHTQYGGKSQATKNARSETPEGFALAFFMANNAIDMPAEMRLPIQYPEAAGAIRQALKSGMNEQEILEVMQDLYEDFEHELARNALIRAVAARTPPPDGAKSSQDAGLEVQSFTHTKSGATVYSVQLPLRLSKEGYQAVNRRAIAHKGRYSAFKAPGVIPGFHFKSEEQARAFATDSQVMAIAGVPDSLPDSLPTSLPTPNQPDTNPVAPDGWRENLIKARVYAKALVDAGQIQASPALEAAWISSEALVAEIDRQMEGGTTTKARAGVLVENEDPRENIDAPNGEHGWRDLGTFSGFDGSDLYVGIREIRDGQSVVRQIRLHHPNSDTVPAMWQWWSIGVDIAQVADLKFETAAFQYEIDLDDGVFGTIDPTDGDALWREYGPDILDMLKRDDRPRLDVRAEDGKLLGLNRDGDEVWSFNNDTQREIRWDGRSITVTRMDRPAEGWNSLPETSGFFRDNLNTERGHTRAKRRELRNAAEVQAFSAMSADSLLMAVAANETNSADDFKLAAESQLRSSLGRLMNEAAQSEDVDTLKGLDMLFVDGRPMMGDDFYSGLRQTLIQAANEAKQAKIKDQARDPLALALQQFDYAPESEDGIKFVQGWEHALDDKTKSTLPSGDAYARGYDSARDWTSTPEGRASVSGRRSRKLKNTGADLRRWFEQAREAARAKQTDAEKLVAQLDKATSRAELMRGIVAEDATPGTTRWFNALRNAMPTFKEWIMDKSPIRKGATSGKWSDNALTRMRLYLTGELETDDAALNGSEQERMDALADMAEQYIDRVQLLVEGLQGVASIEEGAKRLSRLLVQDASKLGSSLSSTDTLTAAGEAAEALGMLSWRSKVGRLYWHFARKEGYDDSKGKWVEDVEDGLPGSIAGDMMRSENDSLESSRKKPLTPPRLDHVNRDGTDYREGKDITPEGFKQTFNFADVGFGEWVGAKRDQDHLNYSHDAFRDLAGLLNLPPEAISLAGKLHFTIGALGAGKYAAHYAANQPHPNGTSVPVINVTNTKGDGTLSHEWAHALDLTPQIDSGLVSQLSQVITQIKRELSYSYNLSTVIAAATQHLEGRSYWNGSKRDMNSDEGRIAGAIKAVDYYSETPRQRSDFHKEAVKLDGKPGKYWSDSKEMFARAFEAWVSDTLEGESNYLVNGAWVADGAVTGATHRGTPYPTQDERRRFNEYFNALAKSLKYEDGRIVLDFVQWEKNRPKYREEWNAALQELRDSMPERLENIKAENKALRLAQQRATEDSLKIKVGDVVRPRADLTTGRTRHGGALATVEAVTQEVSSNGTPRYVHLDLVFNEGPLAGTKVPHELGSNYEVVEGAPEIVAPPAPPPAPQSSPEPAGEMSLADYEKLFDEAAAELQENTQEQPEVPPPGADIVGEPPAMVVEDVNALIDEIEKGTMVLIAKTGIGLPTIHDFSGNTRHIGFGTFEATTPEYTVLWEAGGAMLRLPSGGAYTKVFVSQGTFPYDRDGILATLRAMLPAKKDEQPGGISQEEIDYYNMLAAADAAQDQTTRDIDAASSKTPTLDQAQQRTAAKMAAEAAKLGVEGMGDALSGLVRLFGGGPGKLMSFPGGFNEETYKAAKPFFEQALQKFQASGRTLKELFQFLIQQFGMGIKPYAARFAMDQALTIDLGAKPSASMQVADFVAAKLDEGAAFTSRELFEAADSAWGGTQADGTYSPKDAYDGMEAGVNRWLMSKPKLAAQGSAEATVSVVQRFKSAILEKLPTQTRRDAEMDEFQQFSTPPTLAYVAAWAANVTAADTVMEPSAGTGDLVVYAKNAGASLVLNELSSRRAAVLKDLFPDARIFTENAEQLNNILPAEIRPTVVIMNPPFSATAGRLQGKRSSSNGAVHIEQALKRLAPGGRLVAIMGDGMNYDRPAFRSWYNEIEKTYNVRAVIGIDGREYAKYGTTFDNVILVIDKDGPQRGEVVTGDVDSVEALPSMLEKIREDRPRVSDADRSREPRTDQSKGARDPATDGLGGEPEPSVRDGADAVRGGKRGTGKGGGRSGGASSSRGGSSRTGANRGDGRNDGSDGDGRSDRGGRESDSRVPGQQDSDVTIEDQEGGRNQDALTDALFEQYSPQRLKIPGATKHLGKLVQTAAMSAVEPPAPTYTPNLPKNVITDGMLSDAQLEALVYAGQAHSQMLPNGDRRGFMIGDGTGVGKGREVAGIILDNMRQGRKKALWISFNGGLIEDARRDAAGVGLDPKSIIPLGKTKASGEVDIKSGVLFTTYSTLRGGEKSKDGGATKGKTRVAQIVEWLGEDFDGVIAFDESHKMGNLLAVKGKRGAKKPSLQALAGVELQAALPKARVIYVSATGATEVNNLAYASRLGLWGEGTPFVGVKEFIEQITAGGVAAMELVARDMKALGMYIARSLSFDGVAYRRIDHNLTDLQRDIYNELAKTWQIVLGDVNAALDITNQVKDPNAKSAAMSRFWGTHQRFFNQIITAMMVPSLIDDINASLAAGHSAVIQLTNTGEAEQERQAKRAADEDIDLEEMDFTPRQSLMDYVRNAFPVAQYESSLDANGNEIYTMVMDSNGDPVLNADAVKQRDDLLKTLEAIRVPGNPIDEIVEVFGADIVAEVTGRKRRFVRVLDEHGNQKLVEQKRGANASHNDASEFQNGDKRILIFSQAGGTGYSFHADNTASNKGKRIHYVLQPGWRADSAVQGFGRSHRTNQATEPEYVLLSTNLKAQKRFVSSIARRLDQLGALTRGQREATSQGMFTAADNLESKYAADALDLFFNDLVAGATGLSPTDVLRQMGLEGIKDEYGAINVSKLPEMPQFLNRLLSLTDDIQEAVFDAFEHKLIEIVEYAKQQGTYDLGMETLRAESITKKRDETVSEDQRTGAITQYVELEVTNPVKYNTFDAMNDRMQGYGDKFKGWYIRKDTGEVFAFASLGERVDSAGKIENRAAIGRIKGGVAYNGKGHEIESGYDYVKQPGGVIPQRTHLYEPIDDGRARELFEQQVALAPVRETHHVHMISGVILPIWDRMVGESRIVRTQTLDGERLLGRVIPTRKLSEVLKNLGVGSNVSKMTPPELIDKIMAGQTAVLANGWMIKRSMVSNENRIEVTGRVITTAQGSELVGQGAFTERIQWADRYFIPVGASATGIFERIVASKPVIELIDPKAGKDVVNEPPIRGYTAGTPRKVGPPNLSNLLDDKDPYAQLETRPNTTDAQRDAGRAAMLALRRRLFGMRGERGDRADGSQVSILGAALHAGFQAGKANALTGLKIRSPADLAALAQVYRDPRFETFRAIYVKDGAVVAEAGYSSRLPASVELPTTIYARINADATRFGADGYYLLHNHPGGHPGPSVADLQMTGRIARTTPGFLGHVVIDHNQYAIIQEGGKVEIVDAPQFEAQDFRADPAVKHMLLRVPITEHADIAKFGRALKIERGHATLVLMSQDLTNLLVDVPASMLVDLTNKGMLRVKAVMRRMARESGSGHDRFLILSEGEDLSRFASMVSNGIVNDVVSADGRSLRNAGTPYPGDFLNENNRSTEVREDSSPYTDDGPDDRGPGGGARPALAEPRRTSMLGFYSQLARAFDGARQSALPAAQWKAWIASNAAKLGVKADEIHWSGINDWLDLQGKRKVTKEEIGAYLEQGGVQIEEVTRGADQPMTNLVARKAADLPSVELASLPGSEYIKASDWLIFNDDEYVGQDSSGAQTAEEAVASFRQEAMDEGYLGVLTGGEPKYGPGSPQPFFVPGGIEGTYREVLLTLPEVHPAAVDVKYRTGDDMRANVAALVNLTSTRYPLGFTEGTVEAAAVFMDQEGSIENAIAIQDAKISRGYGYTADEYAAGWLLRSIAAEHRGRVIGEIDAASKRNYRDSHWDEPNIVAHLRMDDRIGPNGEKIMFLHEVQSGWGQTGKKKGFNKLDASPRKATTAVRQDGLWEVRDQNGEFITNVMDYALPDADAAKALEVADARLQSQNAAEIAQSERVPAAPFVTGTKAWVALALKRAIVMAAEGGYDQVAIISGEQAADLYNLSKQVEEMRITKNTSGNYSVHVRRPDNRTFEIVKSNASPSELSTIVGKDLAEKVVADAENTPDFEKVYSGLDLNVGGEGMRAFYDQIVPQVANDALKKLGGGKVGTVRMATPLTESKVAENRLRRLTGEPILDNGALSQIGFDITPAMREKVAAEGLPMFKRKASGATASGLSADQFRAALVDRFGEQGIAALEEQGVLNILDINNPLVGEDLVVTPDPNKPAWYDPNTGQAFFIAQFASNADDAIALVLHEIGEHHGLADMLGERGWRTLKGRVAQMAREPGDVQAAWSGVLATYPEFSDTDPAVLIDNDRFMHEVIAKIGESAAGRKSSVWRDLLAAVNRFLLKMGLGRQINKHELADLVEGSLKRVMGGAAVAGTSGEIRNAMRDSEGSHVTNKMRSMLVEKMRRGEPFGPATMPASGGGFDVVVDGYVLGHETTIDAALESARYVDADFWRGEISNEPESYIRYEPPSDAMASRTFNLKDYLQRRTQENATAFATKNQRIHEQHKTVMTKVKTWLKRQLSPGGLLPDAVFQEKIARDSEFEVIEFDVRHMVGQLERAIEEDYGLRADALDEQTQRLMQSALAGDIDPSIPEATRVSLLGMRRYIDGLSEQYIAALGAQAQDLITRAEETGDKRLIAEAEERARLMEVIQGNVGEYVHRSYRAFDDPNWFKKVPDDVLDAARAYLVDRFSEDQSVTAAEARAEVVLHEILKHDTAYDGIEGFIKEAKLGAKDLSVLKKRKQIAPEIRALLGEHTDPRVNFAKSATKMGRLIWNQAFLERVLDIGMGEFFWTDATKPPEATAKIAADGSEVYSPLNGLWTTPEVNQAFKDALGKEQMADWFRMVVKANGFVKFGKTVLSPTTAARNWMSAFFFSVANGHYDMTQMKKSVDGLKEYFTHSGDTGKLAYLRELKHLGVVYDTPYAGEMMRLLDDTNMARSLEMGDPVRRRIHGGLKMATKFYQYGDDFWKIIGFENEKRMWMETGLSEQEAKVKAAERVRNTYPTYSMVGRGIQALRRFPLAGTFVSFPAEIIRTGYNMVRYMAEDFKHPERRKMAVGRAVGLSIVSAMTYSAQKLSMLLLGFDDDDDEAVRQMAAPWQKNSSFIFTGRDAKGHLRYLDVSFLDPYNYWKRPIMAVMRRQPIDDAIKDAIGEVLSPFFGTDIAAGALFEVMANKRDSGAPVYREHDPAFDQFLSIANHLRKNLQPGIAANTERTWRALSGEASQSGRVYNIQDEMAAWVGFRMSTLDPKVALFYRSFEFKDAKADAERRLRDTIRDPKDVSDGRLQSAHGAMISMRDDAYGHMHTLVEAARKSGMTNAEVSAALRDAGISSLDAGMIVRGLTPKWRPAAATVKNTAQRVSNTFGPEAGRKVQERYRAAAAMD